MLFANLIWVEGRWDIACAISRECERHIIVLETKRDFVHVPWYLQIAEKSNENPIHSADIHVWFYLGRDKGRFTTYADLIDLSTPSPKSVFTSAESRSDLLHLPSLRVPTKTNHKPCRVASASYAIRSMIFPFGTLGTSSPFVVRISLVMLLMSLCLLTGAYAFSSKRSANSRHFADASIPSAVSSESAVLPDISTPSSGGLHMPSFDVRLPSTSAAQPNLFEEYMSRGLYTCTSSYLDALGKLHALMAQVYEDYQNCQKLMKSTPKAFSKTDIDALDDMLADWEREDAAGGNRPPSSQSQEILTNSAEFVREQAPPAQAATPKPVVST